MTRLFGKDKTDGSTNVQRAFEKDAWFYRIIALSLGSTIVLSVIGLALLSWHKKTLPDGLVALASAAVGAFAGVLTAGRSN